MRFTIFFLFTLIFLSISCTKEQDITDIEEEPFMPITNVEVESLVISIGEDIPFTCTINEMTYSSLGGGFMMIKDLLLENTGNTVLIQSEGYFDEIRYVIPRLGGNLHLETSLTKILEDGGIGGKLGEFNAKDGGTIEGFRAEFVIKPNSIVDAGGNLYEGDVRVYAINTFSTAYATNIRRFPAFNYTENEIVKTLNICGGRNLILYDESNNRLYLKNGSTADVSFEVTGPDHVVLPESLEMKYYDAAMDQWVDMGIANKEGDLYNGTLSNLGIVAWGTSYVSRVAQIKLITDEGIIVPNKLVLAFGNIETPYSMAFSDNEGFAKILIPVWLDFKLLTIEISGPDFFAEKEFSKVGFGSEDVVDLEDFELDSEGYQIFNGNIINCNNNVITESAIVTYGSSKSVDGINFLNYFFSDQDGNINFAQRKTSFNPIKLKAFDFETDLLSEEYDVLNDGGKYIDLGSLVLCE